MIREVVKGGTDAGSPGRAADALASEHKKSPAGLPGCKLILSIKKPRRAAGVVS